jgi:hypothetical protein
LEGKPFRPKVSVISLRLSQASFAKCCFSCFVYVVVVDDLAGTVVLGEKIQLLGNLTRVFPEKSKGNAASQVYKHGILFEVNNVLRPRPPEYQMPECIGSVLESKCTLGRHMDKTELRLIQLSVSVLRA